MYRFLGFLCVAALAMGFADYVTQARSEGAEIGTFPISAYMGSIQTRIEQAAAERDTAQRQGELAKIHLPEAPDGWERRAWVRDIEAEHQAMLDQLGAQERALAEQVSNGFIGKMDRKRAIKAAKIESAAQIWEYAKGDEVIRINAKYDPPRDTGDRQAIADQLGASDVSITTDLVEGYAVIQGVTFFKSVSPNAEADRAVKARPIHLWAYMGDAISLHVHAQASEDAIRTILGGIDYDSLNAMLDVPLDDVGSAAPLLTSEQEAEAARAAIEARFKQQVKQSNGADTAQMKAAMQIKGQTVSSEGETASRVANPKATVTQELTAAKDASEAGSAIPPENQPSRLKLSGGRDCLTGATGSFCKK